MRALHWAAFMGHESAVQPLLDGGADRDALVDVRAPATRGRGVRDVSSELPSTLAIQQDSVYLAVSDAKEHGILNLLEPYLSRADRERAGNHETTPLGGVLVRAPADAPACHPASERGLAAHLQAHVF